MEIAAMSIEGNILFSGLIKPTRRISSTASQITGLTELELQKAQSFSFQFQRFVAKVQKEG